ncbi:hypothetical protein GQ600_6546 [Phytophthora cactorum]|nr:hypothetical protein GQ600_6546 [Phytophthora cactorum]
MARALRTPKQPGTCPTPCTGRSLTGESLQDRHVGGDKCTGTAAAARVSVDRIAAKTATLCHGRVPDQMLPVRGESQSAGR